MTEPPFLIVDRKSSMKLVSGAVKEKNKQTSKESREENIPEMEGDKSLNTLSEAAFPPLNHGSVKTEFGTVKERSRQIKQSPEEMVSKMDDTKFPNTQHDVSFPKLHEGFGLPRCLFVTDEKSGHSSTSNNVTVPQYSKSYAEVASISPHAGERELKKPGILKLLVRTQKRGEQILAEPGEHHLTQDDLRNTLTAHEEPSLSGHLFQTASPIEDNNNDPQAMKPNTQVEPTPYNSLFNSLMVHIQHGVGNLCQPCSPDLENNLAQSKPESGKLMWSSEMNSRKDASKSKDESSLLKAWVGLPDPASPIQYRVSTYPVCAPQGGSRIESTAESQNVDHLDLVNCSDPRFCKTPGHKKPHNLQLQDVLKQQAASKEALKSCQVQLMNTTWSMNELKCEISNLTLRVQVAEAQAERWKDGLDELKAHYNILKTVTEVKIMDLNRELELQKANVLNSQIIIFDLKVEAEMNKIESRIAEATVFLKKLQNFVDHPNTSLISAARRNHEELSIFLLQCHVIKSNLQHQHRRLRCRLSMGFSVDLSEIDFYIPPLPHFCREVSRHFEQGTQLNSGCDVPPYSEYELPPPYSESTPNNEDSHNSAHVSSCRENGAQSSTECEPTLANGYQTLSTCEYQPSSARQTPSPSEYQIPSTDEHQPPPYESQPPSYEHQAPFGANHTPLLNGLQMNGATRNLASFLSHYSGNIVSPNSPLGTASIQYLGQPQIGGQVNYNRHDPPVTLRTTPMLSFSTSLSSFGIGSYNSSRSQSVSISESQTQSNWQSLTPTNIEPNNPYNREHHAFSGNGSQSCSSHEPHSGSDVKTSPFGSELHSGSDCEPLSLAESHTPNSCIIEPQTPSSYEASSFSTSESQTSAINELQNISGNEASTSSRMEFSSVADSHISPVLPSSITQLDSSEFRPVVLRALYHAGRGAPGLLSTRPVLRRSQLRVQAVNMQPNIQDSQHWSSTLPEHLNGNTNMQSNPQSTSVVRSFTQDRITSEPEPFDPRQNLCTH